MKAVLFLLMIMLIITGCGMSPEEKTDELFRDYNMPGMPGAAVMVIRNGEIIFRKGYGLANIESNTPVTASTNFRLASVTKQFTAMCILMLVKRDSLSLETSLREVFPELPQYANEMNIRQLLQHTSGLIDYEDLIPDTASIQVKDKDVLEMIQHVKKGYFEPGSRHLYSNTGYALLALTVERISGMPFRKFLEENIFQPLGMDSTLAYENGINEVPQRAYGYSISGDKVVLSDQSITSAVLGDGGIYSSLNDLFKWDQALYTDKMVDGKYLEESWTAGVTCEGTIFPYGYGWHLETRNNEKVVYHTGSTKGFRNIIYRLPRKKFSIIILTNRNAGEEALTLQMAHRVAEIFEE